MKPYSILLSNDELGILGWAVNHGYFPEVTYNGLTLADGQPDDGNTPCDVERVWELEEHQAWAITDLRNDDPDACFACIGGELLSKLLALESSIV